MATVLNKAAKACLKAFSTQLVKNYELDSAADLTEQFSVTPPMETKLRKALLESDDFLRMITTMPVDQIKGQVVKVGNDKLKTGRKQGGRFSSGQDVDGHTYELTETDSCAEVTWAQLSSWANAGNQNEFMRMMSQNATDSFALDMLRIGFNGVKVEKTTDPDTYPMGEDVNIGWHQYVKNKAPDQIVTSDIYFNPDATGALKDSEYKTLDAIVTELKNSLIHKKLRTSKNLVVLIGSDLLAAAQTKLMNQADKPSERVSAQMMDKSIGGFPAYSPPYFPGKRIVLTTLKNLHIYTQRGTLQRQSENVQDRKQYEDKYWRNEGYAVEEFEAYAAVDEANMHIGEQPE